MLKDCMLNINFNKSLSFDDIRSKMKSHNCNWRISLGENEYKSATFCFKNYYFGVFISQYDIDNDKTSQSIKIWKNAKTWEKDDNNVEFLHEVFPEC